MALNFYSLSHKLSMAFLLLCSFNNHVIAQSCLTNLGTVSSKVTVWLKPENAVQSAGAITSWTNAGYSGALSSFGLTSTGASITYSATGLNFNPTVKFNGGQYLQASSVARSTFMPDPANFTIIDVHYAVTGGILISHQTAPNTQKYTHEGTGGFFGSSPQWFTYPNTGSAALTTILGNSTSVIPYGDGAVGTAVTNYSLQDGTNDLIIGAFRGGAYRMTGNFAEVLMYNTALSTLQRNQVESYLASKYGITLDQTAAQNYTASDGTVYWSATINGARKSRITVIGRDDCIGLNQKQSISSETGALVTIGNKTSFAASNLLNTNSFNADKSFLAFGDDNGSISAFSSTGAPAGRLILARKWQVDQTNSVDTVRVGVPDDGSSALVKLPAESGGTVLMLVDADGDFTSGASGKPMTLVAGNWEAKVKLADGNFFTFATLAPGGVLPVHFTSFDATTLSNNKTNLVWNIENEQDIDNYEVEKSEDGIHFSTIATIHATALHNYSFIDVTTASMAYYRIKSVDKDNNYNFSTITRIVAQRSTAINKAYMSANNTLVVQHGAALPGSKIIVSNIDGKLLSSVTPLTGTVQTIIILPSEISKLFVVRYENSNGEVQTMKVLK